MTLLDIKTNLITAVCQKIHGENSQVDKNLAIFILNFFKRIPVEFLQKIFISELVSIAQEAWNLLQTRQSHESLVKIKEFKFNHHMVPRLGIFMVNVDQPFLIDSITNFLEKNGFKIELMVHPVLGVQRNQGGQLISLVDLKEMNLLTGSDQENPIKGVESSNNIRKIDQPESFAFIQIKSHLTRQQIQSLKEEIHQLITQVRDVVSDWPLMKEQLQTLHNQIEALPFTKLLPTPLERQNITELLKWLEHDHFVFLGVRHLRVNTSKTHDKKSSILCLDISQNDLQLGLFREESFRNNDDMVPIFCRPSLIYDHNEATSSGPFSITKTNARSSVHRASRIDSIEVIDWDNQGNPQGIYQFIGIFTKAAFGGSAFDTPIVNRKVRAVFNQFGFAPQWHDGKALINIINSIPRDELFYLNEDQIYDLSQNVLNMGDQHSITLSIRPDIYGRYVTVMVYLPKEKYSVSLKDRFSIILEQQFKGKISSENVLVGELDYARLIFVISFSTPCLITYNQIEIKKALLEAALSWEDYLEHFINSRYDEKNTAILLGRYQKAFPTAYVDVFTPEQAVMDIDYIEKIKETSPIDLYLYQDHQSLKVKIFHAHHALSLSTLLPILQNLGLQVIGETSYPLEKDGNLVWIHDLEVDANGIENWKINQSNLIEAFHHIWNGTAESDVLHQLILKAGLNVRQVTLMRAYLKFLRQVQLPYSFGYLEEILSSYPEMVRHFVNLFELKFSLKRSKSHDLEMTHLLKDISHLLEKIDRLDHDRILRRVLNAIESTVRTNYFQTRTREAIKEEAFKPYLSFKFDCRKLEDLPHPRPLYEIFVYSSRVEAIHLRGAKVSRGGIRWSDRPEDFRTEILGLMKAQTVKNAVIVPLGSKGGFVVKNQNKFTNHAQMMEEVVSCYQMMMRGMLDITDNLVNGKIVHPLQVIRYDEDDPYLVVAADKGTAAFSDIANAISHEYGFWLDDAFASGGSMGYDHKKMGITARGAWESVKRHFRELKHDCQTTAFTVVGVGDMSGDVFGNGMLQSSKIRLLAAFNHRHIFLDPNPDMAVSFKERQRLFEMPDSTWKDYNPELISVGGGIFERAAKSIKLTPQCCKVFGIPHPEMSPDELIKHLLCLPVDLLYFGGIGTFIKATTESHADVGDRANNDVRVDAKTVQAKVIAEGANLGMTQRARIEYALKGGKLNTDAIDNSAGVDCSDHEVNLKILFSMLSHTVSRSERNDLLKKMTNDVAQLVLADNYRQTQILSVLGIAGAFDIHACQSLMRVLETDVGLDRFLEALPDDETLEQRHTRNQGMTRPELSVLLAYTKNTLYEKILASTLPDSPQYRPWFYGYFPEIIQKQFEKEIYVHPLRREITATVLANEVINRVGPIFIHNITQTSGVSDIEVVKAFFLACDVLELKKLWDQVDSLDYLVQAQILVDINQSLEQIVLWFLRHPDVKHTNFTSLHSSISQIPDKLYGDQKHMFQSRNQVLIHDMGINPNVAENLSAIPFLPALLDIMFLGKKHHNPGSIAQTYFTLRSKMGLDWLTIYASIIHADSEWQRSARTILIDDLAQIQIKLTNKVMTEIQDSDVDVWMQKYKGNIDLIRPILANIKTTGHSDLGMLSYVMRQLERLV